MLVSNDSDTPHIQSDGRSTHTGYLVIIRSLRPGAAALHHLLPPLLHDPVQVGENLQRTDRKVYNRECCVPIEGSYWANKREQSRAGRCTDQRKSCGTVHPEAVFTGGSDGAVTRLVHLEQRKHERVKKHIFQVCQKGGKTANSEMLLPTPVISFNELHRHPNCHVSKWLTGCSFQYWLFFQLFLFGPWTPHKDS